MELLISIVAPVITGFISSLGTVLVLKTDIKWIKKEIDNHDERIYHIETARKLYAKN